MDLQLESIIDSLDDAILSLDEPGRVLFLNEAAARAFRCDRALALGQPAQNFPALAEVVVQLKLTELPAGSAKAVRSLSVPRAGEEPTPMEALVTGNVVHGRRFFTAVIRDVSLQQQMEKALYQSRKTQAIGALAGGIAHDFNNMLTAIISHLDLALFARDLPPALKENLLYAKASARRGAELVGKLQQFSRQSEAHIAPVDVTGLIEQIAFMLRRGIDPLIEIKTPVPAVKSWSVNADASQLMQVLVNLGLNARDAMPKGGVLSMRLENVTLAAPVAPPKKTGEFVRITVADTGAGMDPETLQRLFEPYFTTKAFGKGTGLGLSIAMSVVAEHGGWVEVESRLGAGTQVHVFLPRAPQTPPPSPHNLLHTDSQTLNGHERILVVDDEELVRMVIRAVLSFRGYQIVEAVDGEDAVAKHGQSQPPFDLVLMDLHMPRLNGRDALSRIRERWPGAKAIMLSGGNGEGAEPSGDDLTGVRFLPKPFHNHELAELVRKILDER